MKYEKFVPFLVFALILPTQLLCQINTVDSLEHKSFHSKPLTKVNQGDFVVQTLIGHESEVWDVAFSPQGDLLASASSDNSILVWNISTGAIFQNLTGHNNSVFSVAFHPYDSVLASGSFDRTIFVWNLTTGEIMYNLTGHTSSIWSLDFSPDGSYLASGSGDSSVRLWDYSSSISYLNLTGHTGAVRSVQFLPNGILASGSYDNSIILWNITSGSLETIISNNSDNILSVAINPTGTKLVSGSQDNLLESWDLKNYGLKTHPTKLLNDWVRSVAYSYDGYYLASGLENGEIIIWDDISNILVINLTGHTQSIRGLDFHPKIPLLASASGDQTIKLWNVTDLDKDQLPDSWEIENGLYPSNEDDWATDPDGDGLSNINEFIFGTNPQLADSDLDQMSDYYEFIYGLNGSYNDASADNDHDGMPNLYEFLNNLNSALNDSSMDADHDGMPNIYEYKNGLEAGKDDADSDLDNDGLPNIYEYRHNFIIGINDGEDDADSDGLTNREEFLLGTNPRDPDSDNDFFNDYLESTFGSDPKNFFSNPITIILAILVVISFVGVIIFSTIKAFPKIKAKSNAYGRDIKTKAKNIIEYYRPKPQQTWVQDLVMGKAIHVDTLSSELETRKLKLPNAVKASLTPLRIMNKSLVLRSDMLLLEPTPPKETNCQVCIGEISDQQYLQCNSCKRFVCIHDYVDLATVGSTNCPNCSGDLVMFPFSCKGCGLDFSSVIEITGKSGCPLCGYTLADQLTLIKSVTAGIAPSKITETLQAENEQDTKPDLKRKP